MRSLLLASSLALVLVAGCKSDEPKKAAPPVPNGGTATDKPDTGSMVFLRERPGGGERAVVDVVVRGAERDIHGAAFRLHWDPAKVTFVAARGSDAWSRQAVLLAKEGAPGELVVAWTEKGAGPAVHANDETILGSIDFTSKAPEGAALEFRADRSTLRDANGAALEVEWRGGRIAAH